MSALYRLLGVVARVNYSLSHELVNGLPLNWAVPLAAALGLLVSWTKLSAVGDGFVWGSVAGVTVLTLALFVQSQLRRNVVFRPMVPEQPAVATPVPPQGIEFRVSGRFTLDEGGKSRWARLWDTLLSGMPKTRWFLDVPADLAVLESGDLAFISYLDLSLRLFGVIRLENKAGAWVAAARRDSLGEPEWGQLYLGLAVRPALRIRYVDPKGWRRRAVLSFASEGDRAGFATRLQDVQGTLLVSPP